MGVVTGLERKLDQHRAEQVFYQTMNVAEGLSGDWLKIDLNKVVRGCCYKWCSCDISKGGGGVVVVIVDVGESAQGGWLR